MAIRIGEVTSAAFADNHEEIIVACTGRYTGDLELRFARQSIEQLLQALGRMIPTETPPQPIVPAAVSSEPAPPPAAPVPDNPDQVRVEVPRNVAVTADPGGRGYVILIVNHRLQNQLGYAVTPDAAENIASGLTKSAAAVRGSSQSPPK